jgi:hypothetical protein
MVGAVTTMLALAAAYAIALQTVVAGFAALAAAETAAPGLCTSSVPGEQPGRDSGRAVACIACPACCSDGGLSGASPTGIEVPAPRAVSDRGAHGLPKLEARVTPRDRPPTRAPPAAGPLRIRVVTGRPNAGKSMPVEVNQ